MNDLDRVIEVIDGFEKGLRIGSDVAEQCRGWAKLPADDGAIDGLVNKLEERIGELQDLQEAVAALLSE